MITNTLRNKLISSTLDTLFKEGLYGEISRIEAEINSYKIKVHNRNMLIKSKDARIKELENKITELEYLVKEASDICCPSKNRHTFNCNTCLWSKYCK